MVEKCREITENDPKLAEMRSNLEGKIDEKEEVTTFFASNRRNEHHFFKTY